MKYLNIIIITLLLSSCCSTKKVVTQNTEKDTIQVETPSSTIQQPQGGEFAPPKEDDSKVEQPIINDTEVIEIPVESENTIVENDTISEAFNHITFNRLLETHVTNLGNVDYKGLKKEGSILRDYINSLSDKMPNDTWSRDDKLAYWINAYNAMTIDLIIKHYPIKSIKDIDKPWQQRYWKLGEKWYNLDEIEHQIIRKMGEPRIHFALVCAAKSCPKLYNKAFTAKTLNDDLSKLTREFLADNTKNNISETTIKLSRIFKWFTKDFKQDGSLINFLNQYSDITISKNAKKSFKGYNWDLND